MSIEDINYMKANSIRQAYTFIIDSTDRDRSMYPNPNNYVVNFSTPFKNIIGMEIIDASIPRAMYTIDVDNNEIYYYVGDDTGDDIIEKGVQIYNNANLVLKNWNYTSNLSITGSNISNTSNISIAGSNVDTSFTTPTIPSTPSTPAIPGITYNTTSNVYRRVQLRDCGAHRGRLQVCAPVPPQHLPRRHRNATRRPPTQV